MTSSTAEQRRSQQRAETRRAILDATEALLVEGGAEGFSIRRLAERCGYAAPTIYHHFGDKPGLVDALLEERFRRLVELAERVSRGREPLEDLRALGLAFVAFGLRNPTHYRLLSTTRRELESPEPAAAEEVRAILEAPWRTLAAAGRLRTRTPEGASQAFWSLLHGLISLQVSRPDHDWSPTLAEDAVDALLRGLVPDAGAGAEERS